MKAVILAGGIGSRLSEETMLKPKPMVEIGGRPIIWHIMKIYSAHGINDFVICLGYKGYLIKEYFVNYALHMADVTVDIEGRTTVFHDSAAEPWRVTLVDTGEDTMTGGRLRRVRRYLNDDTFFMTYGDGVADVDIRRTHAHHVAQGVLATVTAVRPTARFGVLDIDNGKVRAFREKHEADGHRINGGFFVLSKGALDLVDGDSTVWEKEPMSRLSETGQLTAYVHEGFWHPMDTLRDRTLLETLWREGRAPWKVWAETP
jgi:glucose-1-phosphate cytidylyltransferase